MLVVKMLEPKTKQKERPKRSQNEKKDFYKEIKIT